MPIIGGGIIPMPMAGGAYIMGGIPPIIGGKAGRMKPATEPG